MTLPFILLPGLMCDARLFAHQTATLGATVLPITEADSMAALAAGVLRDAPARFILGGLSMGGIVAMEVVRQAPERVAGLALMDTNPLAELPHVHARRGPQMEKAAAGQLASVMRNDMMPHYLADGADQTALLDLCLDMALTLGADVFVRQSRALRDRADQTETLRQYPGPALVLCGREDRLCPVSRHRLMHDLLPNATLQIIADAAHLPTLERPEETTEALRNWLKEL